MRDEIIKALANHFHINTDINSYDWNSGCTICGNDGEYRWLTLREIVEVVDDVTSMYEDYDED